MSPKRPPSKLATLRPKEWDPTDTQTLAKRIDLAHETEWRHDVFDQIEGIATTLGDVRDTAREAQASLERKVSKEELAELAGRVNLLTERVGTLKHVTWGVLVVFVAAILLQKKGLL